MLIIISHARLVDAPATSAYGICLITAVCSAWLAYCYYTTCFVSFPFDFNMKVCVALSATTLIHLTALAIKIRNRSYSKLLIAFIVGLISASSCELYDFPPLLGLFDAHSVWHTCTIPLGFIFLRFVRKDAEYEQERATCQKRMV